MRARPRAPQRMPSRRPLHDRSVGRALNDRYMGRGGWRRDACKARIIGHLNAPREGAESSAHIEGKRVGVVQ